MYGNDKKALCIHNITMCVCGEQFSNLAQCQQLLIVKIALGLYKFVLTSQL